MNKTISIIVPVFNAQNTLLRCVDSILAQTYMDLELILVDDGSTDLSPIICDEYVKKDKRVKVFHKVNGGPSSARNIGLGQYTGRYLTFVDADDYIDSNMYELLLDELQNANANMLICNWYQHYVSGGQSEEPNIGKKGLIKAERLRDIIASNHIAGGGGFPWNKIIDCSFLGENHIIKFREEVNCYEDKIWSLEMLKLMDSVYISSTRCYHYMVSENSLSHYWTKERWLNCVLAWDIIDEVYTINNNKLAKQMYSEEILFCINGLYKCKDKKNFPTIFFSHKDIYKNWNILNHPKRTISFYIYWLRATIWKWSYRQGKR